MLQSKDEPNPRQICLKLNEMTPKGGLFKGDRKNVHPESNLPWRISPEPFWLDVDQQKELEQLVYRKVMHGKRTNELTREQKRVPSGT